MKTIMDTQKEEYKAHNKEYNEVLNAILKIEDEDPTHYDKICRIYLDIIGNCNDLDVISVESHIIAKYIFCCEHKNYSEYCRIKLNKIKKSLGIKEGG